MTFRVLSLVYFPGTKVVPAGIPLLVRQKLWSIAFRTQKRKWFITAVFVGTAVILRTLAWGLFEQ